MKTDKAVRIDNAVALQNRMLSVYWRITNQCNYACPYCKEAWHDGSTALIPRDTAVAFVSRLAELAARQPRPRTVDIAFSGGEPTLIPWCHGLLSRTKELGCRVTLFSNGSRELAWWEKAVKNIDFAVLSFHPGKASLQQFRAVIDLLSAHLRTHISVSAPPTHFAEAVRAAEYFAANCEDVSILLKPLLENYSRLCQYDASQLQVLREQPFEARLTRPWPVHRDCLFVTHESGRTRRTWPGGFMVEDENHWQGWECDIGLETLAATPGGKIFRGYCEMRAGAGAMIGRIDQPEKFHLPDQPVICSHADCRCLFDISACKRRIPGLPGIMS